MRLNSGIVSSLLLATGIVLLWTLYLSKNWMQGRLEECKADLELLEKYKEESELEIHQFSSLNELKDWDLRKFKAELAGLAQTKRALYESGLTLQEEKRLLEKQLEIMKIYLSIDVESKKISLMKEEQALNDYPVMFAPPKAHGSLSKEIPLTVRIISKERFAHPERGKTELVDGNLTWIPPQVGMSTRSNALGEYVIFTNSDLILHGPQKKNAEHAAYPHYCLGLSIQTAQKLYRYSFIGTRIAIHMPKHANAPG